MVCPSGFDDRLDLIAALVHLLTLAVTRMSPSRILTSRWPIPYGALADPYGAPTDPYGALADPYIALARPGRSLC